jgi:hypothetical protein
MTIVGCRRMLRGTAPCVPRVDFHATSSARGRIDGTAPLLADDRDHEAKV